MALSICGVLLTGIAILLYLNGNVPLSPERPAPQHSSVPVQALDQSAEERAYEAIRNVQVSPEADTRTENADQNAGRPTPSRVPLAKRENQDAKHGYLPPTTLALNCERLRKAYSGDELEKIPGFQEKCKQ